MAGGAGQYCSASDTGIAGREFSRQIAVIKKISNIPIYVLPGTEAVMRQVSHPGVRRCRFQSGSGLPARRKLQRFPMKRARAFENTGLRSRDSKTSFGKLVERPPRIEPPAQLENGTNEPIEGMRPMMRSCIGGLFPPAHRARRRSLPSRSLSRRGSLLNRVDLVLEMISQTHSKINRIPSARNVEVYLRYFRNCKLTSGIRPWLNHLASTCHTSFLYSGIRSGLRARQVVRYRAPS